MLKKIAASDFMGVCVLGKLNVLGLSRQHRLRRLLTLYQMTLCWRFDRESEQQQHDEWERKADDFHLEQVPVGPCICYDAFDLTTGISSDSVVLP